MTDEITLAEQIAAVRSAAMAADLNCKAKPNQARSIDAALATLEAYPRVVAERDYACAELAKARAEIERLRAPPSEDAMEAADRIISEWDNLNPAFTMRELLADAITTAREAEREKYRAVVEAARELCERYWIMDELKPVGWFIERLERAIATLDKEGSSHNPPSEISPH